MIRTLRLVLLVLVVLITSAAVWVSLYTGAEKKRASEAQNALHRSGVFLQPDTTNDIRFGHPNAQKPSPRGSPTPTIP